ncbi:MAG TPA: aminoglycoside phosphotransferase family protein, partial [Microlunatus sp.]|nr:aminoglycoside phosphotransferase family protein [Microlunatus sp.]
AETQGSGYTPGFASRLVLDDGRRVFVKAASSAHPWMIEAYQAEVDKARLLPPAVPAPRVIFERRGVAEDQDWLITGFECVAGRPPARPWREDEATRVIDAVAAMCRALTPPPAGTEWQGIDGELAPTEDYWATIVEQRLVPDSLLTVGPELTRHYLAEHPRTTLIHGDLRDDNVIVGDRVWVCDWNFPVLGPIWSDVLSLVISMHGDGLDADRLLRRSGLVDDADTAMINGFLAALLGYFAIAGRRPEVDNSPYLRRHQRWYAAATADWLLRRLGQSDSGSPNLAATPRL